MESAGEPHEKLEADYAFYRLVRDVAELDEPTYLWEALTARGWLPENPGNLWDNDIDTSLKRLVYDLSWLQVYVVNTDHLSDRVFYRRLYDYLQDCDTPIWPDSLESAISISLLEVGDASCEEWLRFYADAEDRERWSEVFPECPMPPSQAPAFERDWVPVRPYWD
jgi:hypothetical protein